MGLVACKCGCGQKIESSIAYIIRLNGVNFKFLNEDHYLQWRERAKVRKSEPEDPELNKIYDVIITIMKRDPHAKVMVKGLLEDWKASVPVDKIYLFMKENSTRLASALSKKQFSSILNELKYLGAIVKNNALNYKPEAVVKNGKNEQVSKEAIDAGLTRSKKRISLSELEDEV